MASATARSAVAGPSARRVVSGRRRGSSPPRPPRARRPGRRARAPSELLRLLRSASSRPGGARPDWWLSGRLRRDWLWTVVALEVVAAGLALLVARYGLPALGLAVPVLPVVLVLAAGRVRGHWLPLWVWVAARYRTRTRRRVLPAPGGPAGAGVTGRADALLAALGPGARVTSFTDRTATTFGVLRSGLTWSLTLEVARGGGHVLVPAGSGALPLDALPWALVGRDIDLSLAKLVVHEAGQQGGLPAAFRRRVSWISLAVDPRLCPAAVQARGGGVEGALRALTTQAARLAVVCSDVGVRLVPLDADGLRAAVVLAAGTAPVPDGAAGGESWSCWHAGDTVHVTYWVRSVPPSATPDDLLDALARVPVESLTVAQEFARDGGRRLVERTVLRVCYPAAGWERRDGLVLTAAAAAGFRLATLEGLQAPALATALPAVLVP